MSHSEIFVFSGDAKPMAGGVAEFTHQIAKALRSLDRLGAVITPQAQTQELPYSVLAPSPPDVLSSDRDSAVIKKLRAGWMWAGLLRAAAHVAGQQARRREPVLFVTYLDALFGPWLLRFCRRTGVRMWVLFHGVEIIQLQDRHPDLLARAHEQGDRLFFNSRATRELYREKTGREPSSSDILHPSIDFDRLEALEPEPLPADLPGEAVVFSSVCRLVERKGLHRAVRAFREAKERGELGNAVYCIAGKGPELERLRELAGDEAGGSIFFLGYVSEGQKKTLLSRSDGFLHPNYSRDDTDFEGFGISLVEAAWFGSAVLGGDQGGVSEAIGPIPGCELADTEDADRAVTQIRQFIEECTAGTDPAPERSEARRLIHDRLDLKAQFGNTLLKR